MLVRVELQAPYLIFLFNDYISYMIPLKILFQGREYQIQLSEGIRGQVHVSDDQIIITALPEHALRRLQDWLKLEATKKIRERVIFYTDKAGLKHRRVTVKDTSSQWGSCASSGQLSFSWRLIMAPPFVLDYVVAHEVAHLLHPNHSRDFWGFLKTLLDSPGQGHLWLKKNGLVLFKILPKEKPRRVLKKPVKAKPKKRRFRLADWL